MRCFYCNKHEAVKSYERMRKGVAKREYYCLSCYEKLFLCRENSDEGASLSVCPYCERTVAEFETSKLVGCPYCYKGMQEKILPVIVKMQGGDCGHRGKLPPISEENEALLEKERFVTEEEKDAFRLEIASAERFTRQKGEMDMLVAYLSRKDPARAEEYREKTERMNRTGAVEEEIVW